MRANVPFLRRRSGGGTVYHDLGNTNFSIHLPRAAFDRTVTGKLVLRAVQSLGIDAHLNDRNDICTGPDKVSGSAYKLVTKRSYHHGTMLLSTQLDALRDLLRPQTKNMITKGVSSVRSPVCNLQRYANSATHEAFTAAVTAQFRKEYGVTTEPCMVTESLGTTIDYIRHGMEELNTWDWMYGQTPEFVHTLSNSFSWADVVVEIHSKHGLILDVSLRASNSDLSESSIKELAQQCQKLYTGKRYGFLQEGKPISGLSNTSLPIQWPQALQDFDTWLRQTTSVE